MTAPPETPPRPRAGRWSIARRSATHRWTVVGLWLLAVVLDRAGFPDPPVEQVPVQTPDGSALGPGGTSEAHAVSAAVRSLDVVAASH
jgi:RND superfamily putative drug exporter